MVPCFLSIPHTDLWEKLLLLFPDQTTRGDTPFCSCHQHVCFLYHASYCVKVPGQLLYAAASQTILDFMLQLLYKQLADTYGIKIFTKKLTVQQLLGQISEHISMSDDRFPNNTENLAKQHTEPIVLHAIRQSTGFCPLKTHSLEQ